MEQEQETRPPESREAAWEPFIMKSGQDEGERRGKKKKLFLSGEVKKKKKKKKKACKLVARVL